MRRLFLTISLSLLGLVMLPYSAFAQDHPTQYFWGDVTIHVGEETELYIDSEFDYATSYYNFNTTWESSPGWVEVLTPGTSNRTYCTVKGVSNSHGWPTKVECTLAYRTSTSSHQYQVWHGYYNVYVDSNDIKVTSVTLNKASLSLQTGQSESLTATVKPDNATDKTVSWTSSNTSVATVDGNGKVTAVAAGSATVTCKANDSSGKQATCAVTVTNVPVNSITLNKSSLSLQTGQSETLVATVLPTNATNETVTWSSSNTSIATVDSNGKVTAVAAGSATITCKANDGSGVSATCSVTVGSPNLKGDVNGDGEVNGTDLVALTNMILGRSAKTSAADMSSDGDVNGTDYVMLVNIILGK